jgi:lipoprotein-anchoring transpeptidase ErfK/SrfK
MAVGLPSAACFFACADGTRRADTSARPAASASTSAQPEKPAEIASSPPPLASASVSASAAPPIDTGPFLATNRQISWIFEKPKLEAPHAGYLRVGIKAKRSKDKLPNDAGSPCTGGWYAVETPNGGGFVCVGHDGVTLDDADPAVASAAMYPPALEAPLPYGYGTTSGTTLYTRIPNAEEQKTHEGDVAAHVKANEALRAKMDAAKLPPVTAMPLAKIPSFLESHTNAPSVGGWAIPKSAVSAGYAWSGMRMSFLTAFEFEGRNFYLTTENYVVPADRVRAARLADFKGVELAKPGEAGEHLPMIWSRWRPPKIWKLDGDKLTDTGETMAFQAHASIAPKEQTIASVRYFVLLGQDGNPDGRLVRSDGVTRLDAATELSSDIGTDEAWMDVSIGRQTLVLYRGLTPVFTTLVSTGVDLAGDVETTRSTPRGAFRIHSKHYSYRMSADEHEPWKEGDKPEPKYRIDDVPYVQYFQSGYALHAAFWHDSFGQPKSHGCINLSPRDALWLFSRTSPQIPKGWYGVYSGRAGAPQGTRLFVHAW